VAGRSGRTPRPETSLRQLGVERLDLYVHIDDRSTPLEETVDALTELAERGTVGQLGASNHATWRIERARAIARATAARATSACSRSTATYCRSRIRGSSTWSPRS
jgi:aryl-alcohol dehydrogenase-like predicted oxidoreductase